MKGGYIRTAWRATMAAPQWLDDPQTTAFGALGEQ